MERRRGELQVRVDLPTMIATLLVVYGIGPCVELAIEGAKANTAEQQITTMRRSARDLESLLEEVGK